MTCSVEGCDGTVHTEASGYCRKHWTRWRKHGDPLTVTPRHRPERLDVADRFWSKVDKDGPVPAHRPELGPCWLWTGSAHEDGYGRFWTGHKADGDHRLRPAHRVAYEWEVGPIPDGLDLDHLCRVHACVRPTHLEPVTRAENLRRGIGAETTRARHATRR